MNIDGNRIRYGLYNLKSPTLFQINVPSPNINNCTLWNNRLGHPFDENLVHINKKFPLQNLHKSHDLCDTYFNAKHKRLPFPNSKTRTFHYFNLIHMDVWGPISCLVGRKHQHLLGVIHALLFQSNLPKLFWSYALSYVVHMIKRLPSKLLDYNCLFQLVFHVLPDYCSIKTFGCLVYTCRSIICRTKLDSRSRKCIYFGIKHGVKGFIQTEGLDYLETFNPVIKMTTIRMLLSIVASSNWHVHHLDINTTFIHGDLAK